MFEGWDDLFTTMKVNSIDLDNFSVFVKAKIDFSHGINVIIGANGTGKSHLMKIIYSILKANEKVEGNSENNPYQIGA